MPFVAQGPLLCGGAAAAMVERHWGALGVYAEDYAGLVSIEAGGIFTDELAGALASRGYRVDILTGDPQGALRHVRAGIPVVALLESGESRFHYVVIVAVGGSEVRFHDPLRGPDRRLPLSRFLHRWSVSDHWAMAAWLVPVGDGPQGAAVETRPSLDEESTAREPDPLPPALARSMAELRSDRPNLAGDLAASWLAVGGDEAHRETAWRILATARFLAGREMDALAAWNAIGEPAVDLVGVEGLETMAYRTVTDPLELPPRTVLTPSALRLAQRRLLQLPAVRLGRVGYRPLRDGSVQVEAAVLEHRPFPWGLTELASTGIGALVNHHLELGFGPFLPAGERWTLSGSWEEARPLFEATVEVPWPVLSGVVELRSGWMRELFALPLGTSERRWGAVGLRRWVDPETRVGLEVALEQWDGRGRLGRMGLSGTRSLLSDAVTAGLALDGWTGSGDPFGRLRAGMRATRAAGAGNWTATLGVSLASPAAPAMVLDGAGTGRIRAPLLRGHPMIRDGRISGETLGRRLVHGTVSHEWATILGPGARAGAALFVDAARIWDPLAGGGARSFVDPGLELRISAGGRTAAVSLALGGGDWVVSARVGESALPWLGGR
ncbi:MAG TPA: hypothetical protein VLA43_02335 [Longimicrobiales bacterium]|nr:hypothetical protein [Longimicrobiales bacterium]